MNLSIYFNAQEAREKAVEGDLYTLPNADDADGLLICPIRALNCKRIHPRCPKRLSVCKSDYDRLESVDREIVDHFINTNEVKINWV